MYTIYRECNRNYDLGIASKWRIKIDDDDHHHRKN